LTFAASRAAPETGIIREHGPNRSRKRAIRLTRPVPGAYHRIRGVAMPAQIIVQTENETRFEITVRENGSETRHMVTVERDYARKLAGGKTPVEKLVQLSFEFLLEHEPKESILRQFDLSDISRYFPEYEAEIRDRLSS
jgi:hypothetical protein